MYLHTTYTEVCDKTNHTHQLFFHNILHLCRNTIIITTVITLIINIHRKYKMICVIFLIYQHLPSPHKKKSFSLSCLWHVSLPYPPKKLNYPSSPRILQNPPLLLKQSEKFKSSDEEVHGRGWVVVLDMASCLQRCFPGWIWSRQSGGSYHLQSQWLGGRIEVRNAVGGAWTS